MKKAPELASKQERYNNLWRNEWMDLHKIGPGIRTRNRILLKYYKKYIQSGSVLDAGCGDGSFLFLLHKHYSDHLIYEAGDISEYALKVVHAYDFVSSVYTLDLEVEETLPQKQYQSIVSSEVLEHIKDWQKALKHLVDRVQHKGFIFITVPAQMKYWNRHDEFSNHYQRFESGQIEDELTRQGFIIKQNICWGWPFYWLYHQMVLKNSCPQAIMRNRTSLIKVFFAKMLYYLFFIDDLFSTSKGYRLFIVAQKG